MRLPHSLSAILTAFVLLGTLFAAAPAAAADAGSPARQAKPAGLSDRVDARGASAQSRGKRKLRRAWSRGRHAVSNAVGLTASRRPAARSSAQPSDLLFDGSRIADFDLLQAAPGAISEVPDPAGSGETSFQMNVSNNDVYPLTPTDNPRAQALSPPIIDSGDEFWLQTKFMLPQNLPSVKGWMSLVSIYGAPFEGSSPWQIEVADDEIRWERNETYDWDIPWRMPLVKGRWVSVLLHERFASDGWVEMWIDGQQVSFAAAGTRLEMQTMDSSNDEGANAAKIMQYREEGMFDSASVYFGALKVGTTRASVGG
jgi:Polysaccharide lyase